MRKRPETPIGIDFSCNDYLGFSKAEETYQRSNVLVKEQASVLNAATGARLISGNFPSYEQTVNLVGVSRTSLKIFE